ncbi:uncharacterized protein LOC143737818 [Siphateles boraxobius]|uniref:uncharacterized protein LOC143737818 n=1 Tax=Siphateles boraxobius TaxID=180520 RepID=UPI0040649199
MKISFKVDENPPVISTFCCSCVAGKELCNHLVGLLFQSAHNSMMKLKTVPPTIPSTSTLQTWHRPRTRGIHPEAVDRLLVRKPKTSSRSGIKSTLYRAYTGPIPNNVVLSSVESLKSVRPQPLICKVLHGLSEMNLVESKFGLVPKGSLLSYQCPAQSSRDAVKHAEAPPFPKLPLDGYKFEGRFQFVPDFHDMLFLESLAVTQDLSTIIEKDTRDQSQSALWNQMRTPRITSSRFREVCHVRGESTSQALAARIIKGVRQTSAMKRGLDLEPEVLFQYSGMMNVNVLQCGFVVHPDAPHLGTSPDGRVYDPTENPPFGLAEVKCPDVDDISQVTHTKFVNSQAKLKESHKYYWQVQGQLAITGLSWCDFITNTKTDITIQRIWRDESLIVLMRDKVDIFFFNAYINAFSNSRSC